jgi:arylsulfatase A-like enzyme
VYRIVMIVLGGLIFVLSISGCQMVDAKANPKSTPGLSAVSGQASERPNILLVVVDDMGFADLGSFGGEIPTPNLDKLAYAGVRLTNFVTAPACSPTRAMLLTGVDNHIAGLGNLDEELAPNQRGQPGYEGYLNDSVVTIPTLLQDAGYRTYMTGKWHLGNTETTGPASRGFDKSFGMLTNASHFSDMRPAYSQDPNAKAKYRENNKLLSELPDDFEYSSQFFVDRLIDYIDSDNGVQSKNGNEPFLAYLAFSAPHWPLQAPDRAIIQFQGKYDEGHDVIATRRLESQKRLGIIPASASLGEHAPKGKLWLNLSEQERHVEARGMEVYAAMISEVDRHMGRLVSYLKKTNQFDNTVVIFMSDNGPEGHDFDDTWPEAAFPAIRKNLLIKHDFSYENIGRENSYTFYGPNWARASSPAFRMYKAFTSEGGVRAAAFVHYPKLISPSIDTNMVPVKDIAATILDLAGVEHPGSNYRRRRVAPMSGESALGLLSGLADLSPRIHVDELLGKRSVRQGNWKLIHMPPPYGKGNWQLYDLSRDLAEANNLAQVMPNKVAELIEIWNEYASANQVVLPDWVSGY